MAVHREARRIASLLVERLGATGVNVFQNHGRKAGQTVPHYHVHVVPRYPSSNPAGNFREAEFDHTPRADMQALAAALGMVGQVSVTDDASEGRAPGTRPRRLRAGALLLLGAAAGAVFAMLF